MVAEITRVDSNQRLANLTGTNFKDYVQPAVGEWIIMVWTSQNMAALSRTPIVPPGWTTIKSFDTIGQGTASVGIYAKKYTNASDLVTWEITNFSGAAQIHGLMLTGTGADIEYWVIGDYAYRETNTGTYTAKAPNVSAYSNGLAISFGVERTVAVETDNDLTVDNSEKVFSRLDTQTLVVGAAKRVQFGPAGEVIFRFPNHHNYNGFAQTIIIPDVNPTNIVHGYPIKVVTDTGVVDAGLKVVSRVNNRDELITPRGVRQIPDSRFASVEDMMSSSAFVKISHRGGSLDYAEHSLHAYGQSVLWGYSVLDMSIHITIDDVVFGLNDATLLRTSGVDLNPSTMAWSEVSQYLSLKGTPYLRLDELMYRYPNHIITVDAKNIPASRQEYILDIMDSFGGSRRAIAKEAGTSAGWPVRAAARGYKTWGIFYQNNVPNMATHESRWDILGFPFQGTEAEWEVMKSFGKRVYAFTCNNATAINQAISKGADGAMISGTKAGIPF